MLSHGIVNAIAVTGQLSLIDGGTDTIDVQVVKNKVDIKQEIVIAAWMDAVIRALHVDFAKDTEPTVVAMSSNVRVTYSDRICADFIIL